MPELPEVEHVVRALRANITGRQILTAQLKLARIAPEVSASQFQRSLRGARITSVNRRGKYILIELDNGRVLLTHLRMTGKFVSLTTEQELPRHAHVIFYLFRSPIDDRYRGRRLRAHVAVVLVSLTTEQELPRHAHVIFYLDNDRRLVFCDMRQFGRMLVVRNSKLHDTRQIAELAPEPLLDGFSLEYFRKILKSSRRPIKQLLLDQTKILGLGNIYASEALFLARINPAAVPARLSKERAERLHSAIQEILREAIEEGSTLRIDLAETESSYIGTDERFWRVYERAGEPCVRCGANIRRIVQGNRSTYYCPRCQRR